MEIFDQIMQAFFVWFPLLGGGGFFLWKALQLEKARNDEYKQTMAGIREFVRYLHQKEGVK